jgi:hypothetical protein
MSLPAQTLQDNCNRTGPDLGISSSGFPYSSFDLIGSSNLLKIISNTLGGTHPGESAVLTLDRGPDASFGAVLAVLPSDNSSIELIVRQNPTASYGYGGYHLDVTRSGSDYTWSLMRRDPQQPPTLLESIVGPDLEVGGWLGVQAEDDQITGWYVAAADVTTDGSSVAFDVADAVEVLTVTDAVYANAGTYVVRLSDDTTRLDCLTGSGTVVYPDPPENTVLPNLVGAAHTGNILTANPGAWINPVDVFEFQWLRNGNVIAGEITNTYELVLDDENHSISCRVTASNAGGDGEAESLAVLCTRSTFGQPWVHNGVDWVPAFAKVELS